MAPNDLVEESIEERQENEVEVLKSIYDCDFEDLRLKDVWKVRRSPEFLLKIKPDHDSRRGDQNDDLCAVEIHVKCPENYPLSAPDIKLKNAKGINDEMCSSLAKEVLDLSKENVGEVMILEIVTHISSRLQVQQRQMIQGLDQKIIYSSFYEEMQAKNLEEEERRERKKREDHQKHERISKEEEKLILEEVAKTKEALREEKRQNVVQRKVSMCSTSEVPPMSIMYNKTTTRSTSRQTSTSSFKSLNLEWDGVKTLTFLMKSNAGGGGQGGGEIRVERLSCIGNNINGGSVFVGFSPDLQGKLLAISEWNFVPPTNKGTDKRNRKVAFTDNYSRDEKTFRKKLSTIEVELSSMMKFQHPNVVQYLGLSFENQTLRIFEEFVQGSNFSFYLSENISIDLATLRHYSESILKALGFMHEHNFVHRDLRDTSIYLESSGLIRVGDFSIDKRVRDLLNGDNESEDKFNFPLAIGRGGKKVDVYRFGVLILSFAQGDIVQDPVVIPNGFNETFRDFLKKCLNKDERDRWGVDQLLEHRWIKNRIEHLPSPVGDHLEEKVEPLTDEFLKKGNSSETENDDEELEKPLPFYWVGTGQSRLQSEFSLLCKLGKGGYGDVYKVKNNLDEKTYAIKRIQLDPKNKPLTKKLKREVELLSRLNHENVVRYYYSWIEVTTSIDHQHDEQDVNSDEESSSNTYTDKNLSRTFLDSDEDEYGDESEDELFGTSFLPYQQNWSDDGSDDDIVFERSSDDDEKKDEEVSEEPPQDDMTDACFNCGGETPPVARKNPLKEIHFMYIQMEFCDNQTLRNAIDTGLYKDIKRVWRMFREIIEGLLHIHSQGMIHRDLKPVNIFLDSSDQVKIGDFGLATTNTKLDSGLLDDSITNDDMTGQIGTAMYVAPELNTGKSMVAYSQKVDMYSLGIIFFEMCHPPLTTGMERIKILSSVRSKDIILPNECDEIMDVQQRSVIKWLLNHVSAARPTSLELLQSDYIPPPQVEEAQLQEMVKHSLANRNSKSYRHIIDSCLDQSLDRIRDIKYDTDLPKNILKMKKFGIKQEHLRKLIIRIFQLHGAIHFSVPQLLPKGKNFDLYQNANAVKAMTRSGNVVFLPYDLRIPLARYVAKSKISQLRRYSVAPVFREKRIFGLHPTEIIECAFDIITSGPKSAASDAECLQVVDEIINSIPSIKDSGCFFQINHVKLLKGLLNHFGIDESNHELVYTFIRQGTESKKMRMEKLAISASIPEQVVGNLFNMLEKEGTAEQLGSAYRPMIKRNNEAGNDIKKALQELEAIIKFSKLLGVKSKIVIRTSLIPTASQTKFGKTMICQMVMKNGDILAAGGRYDDLIQAYSSKLNIDDDSSKFQAPGGVGMSISLDLLASRIQDGDDIDAVTDVLIHSTRFATDIIERKLEFAHHLWSKNISCSICDPGSSLDDVQDWASECGAKFVVIFQDGESMTARLRTMHNDAQGRFHEKKMFTKEIMALIIGSMTNENDQVGQYHQNDRLKKEEITIGGGGIGNKNITEHAMDYSCQVTFDYNYYPSKKRKDMDRISDQIKIKLSSALSTLSATAEVSVLVLPFSNSVIRSISSAIISLVDCKNHSEFKEEMKELIAKHPKHKNELTNICDDINELKSGKGIPPSYFVLYSMEDQTFKILML